MKKLLLSLSLVCGFTLNAQTLTTVNPNCAIQATFTNSGQSTASNSCGSSPVSPNTMGLINWTLAYYVDGFSAVSVLIESAPDANGVPGTWVTFAGGTVSAGTNPSTVVPQGLVQLTGYNPWVRVTLTSKTGATGKVVVKLYGSYAGNGGGGGGGGGTNECATIGTPCYVVQPTASVLNDTSVETLFNGATQSKAITCTNRAAVSISGSGETQIIAASGTTQIYICSLDLSGSGGSNFNVAYGTGSNCGTGTTAATGVYQNVLTYSSPWNAVAPLILPAGKAACLNFASSVTVGGTVIYAQF